MSIFEYYAEKIAREKARSWPLGLLDNTGTGNLLRYNAFPHIIISVAGR